jgi:4-hydroxy-2-oxoheptanedioate aldolase
MYTNTLKETMKKRPVFGMTIYTGSPAIVEALGIIGYDFAFIDAEHCPWEVTELREVVMAARQANVSPLVRITRPDEIEIRKAFEMGAEGVIIPHVHNVEEMKLCVKGAKFPPLGRRGYDSTVRSAGYGYAHYDAAKYIENSNSTELVIPMAEDFEFLDDLDSIMAVPGIDAINFGPADFALSKNIRIFYDMTQPDVQDAMTRISAHTKRLGIGLMAPAVPPTVENVETLISRGVNMLIMGSDMYNFQSTVANVHKNVIARYL